MGTEDDAKEVSIIVADSNENEVKCNSRTPTKEMIGAAEETIDVTSVPTPFDEGLHSAVNAGTITTDHNEWKEATGGDEDDDDDNDDDDDDDLLWGTTMTTAKSLMTHYDSSNGILVLDGEEDILRAKSTQVVEPDPEKVLVPSGIDELMAQEMKQLSMKEREEVQYDIHGVASVFENDDLVNQKLAELDANILNIVGEQKVNKGEKKFTDAYVQASQQSPSYVSDPKLRLMFLRADKFDAKRAANRLVRFFEQKLNLFGVDKLTKNIRLEDLNDKDMDWLKCGNFQLLPSRDLAGRAIVCCIPGLGLKGFEKAGEDEKLSVIQNMLRAHWYLIMTGLLDGETQQKGIVFLVFNHGRSRTSYQYEVMVKLRQVRQVLPQRVVGTHYVYDDILLYPLISIGLLLIGRENRARFRTHYGSDYIHELLTYGIPKEILPIDEAGSCDLEHHLYWLQSRQKQEVKEAASISQLESNNAHHSSSDRDDEDKYVIIPTRFDVLFGRGKAIPSHVGNLRANHIVEMNRQKYDKATKYEKTALSERIVQIIHESNGRFLKQEDYSWVEVDDLVAREKVSHWFRRKHAQQKLLEKASIDKNVENTSTKTTKKVKSSRRRRIIGVGNSPNNSDCGRETGEVYVNTNKRTKVKS